MCALMGSIRGEDGGERERANNHHTKINIVYIIPHQLLRLHNIIHVRGFHANV